MKLEAKPANYNRAFLGEAIPPCTVEEIGDSLLAESPCVVVELQDIEQAIHEGIEEHSDLDRFFDDGGKPFNYTLASLANDPNRGIVRYFLHLSDARALCCHLIHVLANTDDRIARQLEEVIKPAIQDAAAQDGDPGPYGEDNDWR